MKRKKHISKCQPSQDSNQKRNGNEKRNWERKKYIQALEWTEKTNRNLNDMKSKHVKKKKRRKTWMKPWKWLKQQLQTWFTLGKKTDALCLLEMDWLWIPVMEQDIKMYIQSIYRWSFYFLFPLLSQPSLAFLVLMSSLIQLMYVAYCTSVYWPAVMVPTLRDRFFFFILIIKTNTL